MRKEEQNRGDGEGTESSQIDPTRLMQAVDAIIEALEEYKIDTRGGTIAPTELLGSPMQPKVLCDFTRWEIEQATVFMTRMGLLEPARAKKA